MIADGLRDSLAARNYQLRERVGEGAFAMVFRAVSSTGDVAVKIGGRENIEREYAILAPLQSAHLPRAIDCIPDADQAALVMSYVQGQNMLSWSCPPVQTSETTIRRNLPMAFGYTMQEEGTSAFRYCGDAHAKKLMIASKQVLKALKVIHNRGALHLDLHPMNILVAPGPNICVLDLGLSLLKGDLISPERFVGSAAYMAPELAIGKATEASDYYSLGVILFECLTSQLPFSGGGGEVLVRKQSIEAPRLEDVLPNPPEELARLCQTLLRRDPLARVPPIQL